MKRIHWPWGALVFAIGTGCAVWLVNAQLRTPLEAFVIEYRGGGSCKLRENDAFRTLIVFALLSFPASLFAAVHFLTSILGRPWRSAFGLCVSLATLAFLIHLHFVKPALGICP